MRAGYTGEMMDSRDDSDSFLSRESQASSRNFQAVTRSRARNSSSLDGVSESWHCRGLTSRCVEQSPLELERALHNALQEGLFSDLVYHWKKGSWPKEPYTAEKAVRDAALKGKLLEFLENFQLPLHKSVRTARLYLKLATEKFKNVISEGTQEHGFGVDLVPGYTDNRPTRYASLFANYLMVPRMDDELTTWLKDGEEDMVVFRPADSEDPVQPLPAGLGDFPERLGALYLMPRLNWRRRDIKLDDGVMSIQEEGEVEPLTFKTTDVYPLPPDTDGVSPSAEKFVYCFGHSGSPMPMGGFLYLDREGGPVEVMALTKDITGLAIRFDEARRIGPGQSKSIQSLPNTKAPTVPAIKDAGCTFFTFLGPEQLGTGIFEDCFLGGYAYLFKDRGTDRYFPIKAFCTVEERCSKDKVDSAALFQRYPSCEEVLPALCGTEETRSEQVKFKRLRQPGMTHPVVLWSLARTSNKRVLECEQAMGIVSASFGEARLRILIDIVCRVGVWWSVSFFTRCFRRGEREWEWKHTAYFSVLVALALRMVMQDVCIAIGARACLSAARELCLFPRIFLQIVNTASTWCLVVMVKQGIYQHYPKIGPVFLATSGTMCWLHQLFLLRGFRTFGRHFLPITTSLSEASSFLLVSFFILMASFQISYAITRTPMSVIVLDTYRMAFAGDMRTALFVDEDSNLENGPKAAQHLKEGEDVVFMSFAYVMYMLFGFLVMVSLSNIFIQVIGDAYQKHMAEVRLLLVRSRAIDSLLYSLEHIGLERIGLCHRREGEDGRFVWFVWRESAVKDEKVPEKKS